MALLEWLALGDAAHQPGLSAWVAGDRYELYSTAWQYVAYVVQP